MRRLFCLILLTLSASLTFAQATTTNLGISKPQTGQNQPQVVIATGFDAFDNAIAGRLSKSVAGSSDVTLTATEARNAILELTGAITANINLIVPAKNKLFAVYNATTGAFTVTVKTPSGTGVVVPQGQRLWVYCDSTNVVSLGATATSATAVTVSVANDGTTGTLANGLAKLTGAPSTAIRTATSDTGGAIGVVTGGHGTSGSATIQIAGQCSCLFSGATTAGNYVVVSDATAGNCKDGGSSFPTSGQAIGRVLSTNGSGGTYSIMLFGPEERGGSGGGSGLADPGGNGIVARTALNTTSARTITGTSNEIAAANGDGASGNPTLSLASTFDISGKTSTKPVKTGTSDPATCSVGEMLFRTDATAGQNLKLCTATNTWTQVSGTGGGSTAWSSLTDPSGNLSRAMGANLTNLTWGGNFGSSSAFRLAGADTTATGPLLHLSTGVSNNITPMLVEPRGGQAFRITELGNVVIGAPSPISSTTSGFPYFPVIQSNAEPSGAPTAITGAAPLQLEADAILAEYRLWAYMGSAWQNLTPIGGMFATQTGSGAQAINWGTSYESVSTRQITMTGNVTLSFTQPRRTGTICVLITIQDATGSRNITWPASVKWPGGSAGAPTTAANAKDTWTFVWDGSNYQYLINANDVK